MNISPQNDTKDLIRNTASIIRNGVEIDLQI